MISFVASRFIKSITFRGSLLVWAILLISGIWANQSPYLVIAFSPYVIPVALTTLIATGGMSVFKLLDLWNEYCVQMRSNGDAGSREN
jgi:hypothetical protein